MKQITEAIAATSEIMGRPISPLACAMMAKKLGAYPKTVVMQALNEVSEGKGSLTFEAIKTAMERINPDGRPGADEAWAMIPRDESVSVVMTEEMSEAYGIALPLLNEGDQIAARMAFKESYLRITDANKRNGIKPKWFPSLGSNKDGREEVLKEAVRLGRLPLRHAVALLPPDRAVLLEAENSMPLLEEKKSTQEQQFFSQRRFQKTEHGLQMLKDIKEMLKRKEIK